MCVCVCVCVREREREREREKQTDRQTDEWKDRGNINLINSRDKIDSLYLSLERQIIIIFTKPQLKMDAELPDSNHRFYLIYNILLLQLIFSSLFLSSNIDQIKYIQSPDKWLHLYASLGIEAFFRVERDGLFSTNDGDTQNKIQSRNTRMAVRAFSLYQNKQKNYWKNSDTGQSACHIYIYIYIYSTH